ncbi:uncharacterized protein LOC129771253 [Toxorhynchites rutilus septentrionalis]|uniref:uncharacterized protein LOC129771253 n=1 Tax=Toxorhynchites rutilus septentrionalis TaxID=329112 RepID=UPI002478672E|nr:uncharacterized protein LOC129771253 [Toxorhynchites rutilus septentrionalis]
MNLNTSQNQTSPGTAKEELDDFERFALDNLVRNEWGLKVATLNRLMYCGVSVECLGVIEEHDLNDIFNDERTIGQKILLRHRLREWRKGLHWNSPEHSAPTKRRYERRSTTDRLNVDKKPRISTSHQIDDDVIDNSSIVTTQLMLPDTHNQSTTVASSASSSSSNGANTIPDSANLPIRVTPEAMAAFLQGNRSGRWVLNYFSEHHRLDKKPLTELTHMLVEPFLIYNITFTHALMRHYAEVIVMLFPSEQAETFYCPRNTLRKNPTGKLYDRYVNQRLRYKTKYNAQRPTMVDESQLHRTFAEMTAVPSASLRQQYLDYAGEHPTAKIESNDTQSLMGSFSEESMNVYGAEDGGYP